MTITWWAFWLGNAIWVFIFLHVNFRMLKLRSQQGIVLNIKSLLTSFNRTGFRALRWKVGSNIKSELWYLLVFFITGHNCFMDYFLIWCNGSNVFPHFKNNFTLTKFTIMLQQLNHQATNWPIYRVVTPGMRELCHIYLVDTFFSRHHKICEKLAFSDLIMRFHELQQFRFKYDIVSASNK